MQKNNVMKVKYALRFLKRHIYSILSSNRVILIPFPPTRLPIRPWCVSQIRRRNVVPDGLLPNLNHTIRSRQ